MTAREALAIAALLALAAGCAPREEPGAVAVAGDDDPVVDALFASMDRPGSPGCALGVARNGTPVYTRGYGYANLDHGIPVTPRTVFDVGSLTKQFVAASLSLLELEGTLSLDDDVRRWLPELPAYEQPVTLRHMVHHTSGLRDYLALFPLAGRNHYHPISHARILDMMSRQRALQFPPGERVAYSNTAYMLLAQVVERASGLSLGAFARQRFFGPLGMDASLMYDERERIIPRRATGYDRHADDDVRMVHNLEFAVAGDGQLYTTVEDLLRWDEYLHGAVKPAIHAAMLTEGRLGNGEATGLARGLFLDAYRGQRTVRHTGSSWGFQSVLVRFLDQGLTIAIACNDGLSDPERLAHRIADHYLAGTLAAAGGEAERVDEAPEPAEGAEGPAPAPGRLHDFSGTYYSGELDVTYRFAVVADALVVRIGQEQPLAVRPAGGERFSIRFDEQAYSGTVTARVAFERDADGSVIGFTLDSAAERGLAFRKQP